MIMKTDAQQGIVLNIIVGIIGAVIGGWIMSMFGEAGTTGSLPAVMNAVVDALRALGINHFDMPATPARLWQAIHDAGARQRAA